MRTTGHPPPLKHDRVRGFTLTELLITVTVIGVLASLAAPSFVDLIRNNRAAGVATEIASGVNYARSEAIRRSTKVTICKSANPTASSPACAGSGGWQQGWIVFVDKGTGGSFESASDTLLRVGQPPGSNVTIASSTSGGVAFHGIAFNARGMPIDPTTTSSSRSGSMTVCVGSKLRTIQIGTTGRISIVAGSC